MRIPDAVGPCRQAPATFFTFLGIGAQDCSGGGIDTNAGAWSQTAPGPAIGRSLVQLVEAGSSHTDWSLIVEAGHSDEQAAGDALERLLRRYWPAVYAYIRSTGRDVHESADLSQGFVCDIIISRRLCAGADPHRGRFRTLLLSAVKNYLRQQHRRDRRMLRSPQRQKPLKLTDSQLIVANLPSTPSHRTPDQAFCYQWTATLIRRVLDTFGAE